MAMDEVIVIKGIKETVDALKQFDKQAVKNFNKVINDGLTDAERTARGFVKADSPMRGWRKTEPLRPRTRQGRGWPAYSQSVIQQGIKKTRAEGKVRADYTTSAGALVNKSAAGAIMEVAGRKSGGNGTGQQFIYNLTGTVNKPSRLIWTSIDRKRFEIQAKVVKALEDAKQQLQAHLNRERD
jgi:uncharacterized protein YfaP (DUF2135 family)